MAWLAGRLCAGAGSIFNRRVSGDFEHPVKLGFKAGKQFFGVFDRMLLLKIKFCKLQRHHCHDILRCLVAEFFAPLAPYTVDGTFGLAHNLLAVVLDGHAYWRYVTYPYGYVAGIFHAVFKNDAHAGRLKTGVCAVR